MSNKTAAKRQKTFTDINQPLERITDEDAFDVGRYETPIIDLDEDIEEDIENSKKQGINVRKNFPTHAIDDRKSKFTKDANIVAGNDPDNDLLEASMSGDASVVGGNPTPEQADVDLIGRAVGLEYEDSEELSLLDKIESRDVYRWELEPESSEDFKERSKQLSTPKKIKNS